MKKFYVIGYDAGEQETFYAHVIAENEQAAMAKVDAVGHDTKTICAFEAEELLEMGKTLCALSEEQVEASWIFIAQFIRRDEDAAPVVSDQRAVAA